MSKAFIIIFEIVGSDTKQLSNFHKSLSKDPNINGWWHHLTSTYIITTPQHITVTNVREFVKSYIPTLEFLVLQIKYNNYDGYLPQEAWDWIENSLKKV